MPGDPARRHMATVPAREQPACDVVSFEELVADIDCAGQRPPRCKTSTSTRWSSSTKPTRSVTTPPNARMRCGPSRAVPKDLVVLTATPVNNSLEDLYALIMYFAPNDAAFADVGIPSLRQYFNRRWR